MQRFSITEKLFEIKVNKQNLKLVHTLFRDSFKDDSGVINIPSKEIELLESAF